MHSVGTVHVCLGWLGRMDSHSTNAVVRIECIDPVNKAWPSIFYDTSNNMVVRPEWSRVFYCGTLIRVFGRVSKRGYKNARS